MRALEHPLLLAHRGASGYLPEHTLAAYFLGIQQGADFIEPDLVMSRDGVLVVRHENEISASTDVAERPEFAARRTGKVVDGVALEGWFTEDFTVAELKTLRCRERIPHLRPSNSRFDRAFEIATFDEVLSLVQAVNRARLRPVGAVTRARRRPVGVYPETKHPSYFASIGLPMEDRLLRALKRYGYRGARAPVFIQCFETANLRALSGKSRLPRILLVESKGRPFDFVASGRSTSYADLMTPAGLREVATFATGIGVHKDLVIPRDADGRLAAPSSLVLDAHAAGLKVHVWTMRAENEFLPRDHRSSEDPASRGDLVGEIRRYLDAGIDAFFTDHPDIGFAARAAWRKTRGSDAEGKSA
jgi:glycerophosphoryl diester phosphodiesterase